MPRISINCPKCDSALKLKDRSRLGRKGKCPNCGHSFVLKEESGDGDEVDLELAAQAAVPVGTSARWVPDDAPLAAPAAAPAGSAAAAPDVPALPTETDDGGLARLRRLKQRRAQRRKGAILVGALTAVVIMGVVWVVRAHVDNRPHPIASDDPETPAGRPDDPGPVGGASSQPPDVESLVEAADPTDGEPIQLFMMPSGVNVVIHLRPAELWSDDVAFQELRATLTQNFTDWLSAKLLAVCRREPAQIEEALIGIILGSRGTEPEFATVVRLKEEAALSDLIEEFRGEPLDENGNLRLTRSGEFGYLILDTKTFAICPAYMAAELREWITTPNYNTTEGILELLRHTDRERLCTVVFEIDDVRRHAERLFAEETRTAVQILLDAVSDDAETMSWSMHLDEEFYSDVYLRTRVAGSREVITPRRLAEGMSSRLDAMPHEMLAAVLKMDPRLRGNRTIIGRYPAMLEVFQMATVTTTGPRYARLTTVLPAKAAPNLALATMLTWDESRRTDFSATEEAAPVMASTEPELPESVAQRLQLEIDAEFNRTPLYAAFEYIAGEIGLSVDIDGAALMDGGYTQNIPQSFNLGKVPATAAIYEIIKDNDGDATPEKRMVIAVDEARKLIIVTTEKFAEQNGQEIFGVGPAG